MTDQFVLHLKLTHYESTVFNFLKKEQNCFYFFGWITTLIFSRIMDKIQDLEDSLQYLGGEEAGYSNQEILTA